MSQAAKKYPEPQESNHQQIKDLLAKELAQLTALRSCEEGENPTHKTLPPPPEHLFSHLFPLTCPRCHKNYPSRSFYLAETKTFDENTSSPAPLVFCEGGISEERQCSCGETLTLTLKSEDQRDGSYLGVLKRILFENCLHKLSEQATPEKRRELKALLRHFFHSK